MTGPGTYWRTLKHLRLQQWFGRVRHRLRRAQPAHGAPPPLRPRAGPWAVSARRPASLVGPGTWRLLNETHALDQVGWDDARVARLWRYNQHYFDDLNALEGEGRRHWQRELLGHWVAANPPAGGTAWEPYPVSLRLVNWIKWALAGEALQPDWIHSLAIQARWLREHLETHLLGNHLFANAKALMFAGLYFDGAEAARWLKVGRRLIDEQLDEQFLADGGHFERSPMYHALALEDLLDLVNVLAAYGLHDDPLTRRLRAQVPAMQQWLRTMTHPDGTLGMFNDAAQDIAPPATELDRLATALGLSAAVGPSQGLVRLAPSGYIRWALSDAVALLDVAPVGPDHLPGHAHADTLSFELSIRGRRVVVNGGTSCYGDGSQRQHERSTASHSTVQICGHDSSEVWSGFRVGRRARPVDLHVDAAGQQCRIGCAHDGYRFLPGRPTHHREWAFDADTMVVRDRVAPLRGEAVARYLLAPGLHASTACGSRWVLRAAEGWLATVDVLQGQARLAAARCTTRFGVLEETTCLIVALTQGQAATRWQWRHPDAHPLPH